ncbi:MAG: NAD(P)H-dependent glycerol-3-phosphate dehydrogenase [Thermoanaerobacterales bacterium]|jgi:glycerol-3-phosphate dehydrogenase (NAD(P)+)|nr:NAD(P)H-dependent glycerol-3-phosphate dehydrogenase [Thermoanaerobacterales bacterium]
MPIRVAVVGAGSWGTTVAALASLNTPTVLWARRPELAEAIARTRRNPDYLPDFELPEELEVTASLAEAVGDADVLVMGVPSHGMRSTLRELAPHVRPWIPVMSLAKGLEEGTHLRMTEVIEQELPGHPVGVMTGPNLAREIMAGHAAATVVAFSDQHVATELQRLFARELFRVYTNHDVVGCELGGALKNVFAIASGMADGLGTGDNTRAAVITRSLAELSRLGLALGGEVMTFAGLAGMGDLVATCISRQSRNRYVGEQLGRGRRLDEIVAEMRMVAEGIKTSRVAVELARRHEVEMPIAEAVYKVVHEGRPATEAYRGLLRRGYRPELHGMS